MNLLNILSLIYLASGIFLEMANYYSLIKNYHLYIIGVPGMSIMKKLKKHLSAIDKISERLKKKLQPIQTDFAKCIVKKKQYINSFCLSKRQVSNKELLFLLEQYEIFKTTKDKKSR